MLKIQRQLNSCVRNDLWIPLAIVMKPYLSKELLNNLYDDLSVVIDDSINESLVKNLESNIDIRTYRIL